MSAIPVTIVADTSADALRLARVLLADGCPRVSPTIGGDALRLRLLTQDAPAVVVLDLFMDGSPARFLTDLRNAALSMDGAVVVAVTDDPAAALAAGADQVVTPDDPRQLCSVVRSACATYRDRSQRRPLVGAAA